MYVGRSVRPEVEEELQQREAHDERGLSQLVELARQDAHCPREVGSRSVAIERARR
jgi:hypothetical protein